MCWYLARYNIHIKIQIKWEITHKYHHQNVAAWLFSTWNESAYIRIWPYWKTVNSICFFKQRYILHYIINLKCYISYASSNPWSFHPRLKLWS